MKYMITEAELKKEVENLNARIEVMKKGLLTHKSMLDLILAHFNLEPVTTQTVIGEGWPESKTILQKKKSPKKEIGTSLDNDEED